MNKQLNHKYMFLKRILEKIATIPYDKLLHFIVGMLITLFAAVFPIIAPFAFISGIIAGFLKELYDKFFGGDVDWKDIVATMIGAVIAQLFIYCYLYL